MTTPNPGASRPTLYYGWYVAATLFFIAFLSVGTRNAFGIFVVPMSKDFHWDRATISLVAALGFLVNGVTQPFLGQVFDRLGARRVFVIGLIIMGLATFALSFTFHIIFMVLVFGLVLSPALSGPSVSNSMALLSKWFVRRRATAVALNTTGSSIGGLLLVPFAMYLLQATNWRVTWAAVGLMVLVLAVPLAFLFIRNDPAEKGVLPDGATKPAEGGPTKSPPRQQGHFEVDRWLDSYRTPPIWQLSAAYTVCGITTGIISVHFVPLAIDRGVSEPLAAIIFGVMTGLNALGGIGAGMLSDRFRRKNILALVYLLRGVAYALLLLLPSSLGLWAFALAAGFSWVASVPLTAALTADVYGVRALGTISGVTYLCQQIGSFCSVLLAGFLYDVTGSYTLPFAIAGSLLFPAAFAAFTIQESKYSTRYQVSPATAEAAGG